MPRLFLKDDTRNPSGSTKDRASHLVVAKAIEYGYETVAAASTGNAATALSAAGAAAGIKTVVFVPATAPPAKLVQMASYGATLVPVAGTYDQAFELSLEACARFGWYNRNTALNPFTVEGKKTASLEIARDLAPEAPDVVVVPTGDGVIIAGIAKGFADLVRCGLLPRVPRLVAVQPERSGAIARALRSGAAEITPEPDAGSVADSLTVVGPPQRRDGAEGHSRLGRLRCPRLRGARSSTRSLASPPRRRSSPSPPRRSPSPASRSRSPRGSSPATSVSSCSSPARG